MVIDHGHDYVVGRGVVGDAAQAVVGLGDGVVVGTRCGVGDRAESRGQVVLGSRPDLTAFFGHRGAVHSGQGEGEAFGLAPVVDGLGGLELAGTGSAVGVGDGQAVRTVIFGGGGEGAVVVVHHGDDHVVGRGIIGDIGRAAVLLGNGVVVGARGGIGDGAEVHDRGVFGGVLAELAIRRARGHGRIDARVVRPGFQDKGEAVSRCPVVEGLGSLQLAGAGGGIGIREGAVGGVGDCGNQVAVAVVLHGQRNGNGSGGAVPAVGAGLRELAVRRFRNRIGIRVPDHRFVQRNGAEVDFAGCAQGNGGSRRRRRAAGRGQGEDDLAAGGPLRAGDRLIHLDRGRAGGFIAVDDRLAFRAVGDRAEQAAAAVAGNGQGDGDRSVVGPAAREVRRFGNLIGEGLADHSRGQGNGAELHGAGSGQIVGNRFGHRRVVRIVAGGRQREGCRYVRRPGIAVFHVLRDLECGLGALVHEYHVARLDALRAVGVRVITGFDFQRAVPVVGQGDLRVIGRAGIDDRRIGPDQFFDPVGVSPRRHIARQVLGEGVDHRAEGDLAVAIVPHAGFNDPFEGCIRDIGHLEVELLRGDGQLVSLRGEKLLLSAQHRFAGGVVQVDEIDEVDLRLHREGVVGIIGLVDPAFGADGAFKVILGIVVGNAVEGKGTVVVGLDDVALVRIRAGAFVVYCAFRRQLLIDVAEGFPDVAAQLRIQQVLAAGEVRVAEVDVAVCGVADDQGFHEGFLGNVFLNQGLVGRIVVRLPDDVRVGTELRHHGFHHDRAAGIRNRIVRVRDRIAAQLVPELVLLQHLVLGGRPAVQRLVRGKVVGAD